MKKYLLFLICLTFTAMAFGQNVDDVQQFTFTALFEAAKQLISCMNWKFIILFMLITWLINDTTDATNVAKWLEWLSKISRSVRAFVIGLIMIVIFAWVFEVKEKLDIFGLFVSLLVSLAIYKFGINKVLKWLSKRIGLKFEETEDKPTVVSNVVKIQESPSPSIKVYKTIDEVNQDLAKGILTQEQANFEIDKLNLNK